MRPDKESARDFIRGMMVLSFGAWAGMLGWLGKSALNKLDSISERQHEMMLTDTELKTRLQAAETNAQSARAMAEEAIKVRAQHGNENNMIRERILRLEADK